MLGAALFVMLAGVQTDPSAATADQISAVVAPIMAPPPLNNIAPPSVADSDIREYIAIAARKQAGRPAYGGIGPVDKLIVVGRGRGDYPEIIGSAGVPQRQQLLPPPEGAVAVVRFRQSRDPVMPGPSRQDIDYAATHKLPLFVIGEWSRAIPMWEVAWTGQAVQYRSIGDVGEIGPWQE